MKNIRLSQNSILMPIQLLHFTFTLCVYATESCTRGEDSWTKAKPLFWPVCLSLMRRMLLGARLAYGARAVMMASTVVRGAIFRRMIAKQKKNSVCKNRLLYLVPSFGFALGGILH